MCFFFLIEWNQLFGNYLSSIFLIQDPLRKQVVYFSIIKLLQCVPFFLFSFLLSTTLVVFLFFGGEGVRHCNYSLMPCKQLIVLVSFYLDGS